MMAKSFSFVICLGHEQKFFGNGKISSFFAVRITFVEAGLFFYSRVEAIGFFNLPKT